MPANTPAQQGGRRETEVTTENELSSKKRNWEVKSRFSSVKMRPVKHSTSEETTTIALIHPVDRNLIDFFLKKLSTDILQNSIIICSMKCKSSGTTFVH